MKNQKLLSFGVAAVAVASIAAGSLLFADGSDTSASALGLSDAQVSQIAADVAATAEADREAYLQKLATNLGVDLDKLKEAIKTTNLQTLDEKVAAGTITQERADETRERIESGDAFFFAVGGRGFGGPGGHGGSGGMTASSADLAAFFGIEEATLRTEQQTKSLATIAGEHGKSRDELKAFLTAGKQESLAALVTAGTITQAEADAKLAEFTAGVDEKIDTVHAMGERGPRGDRLAPGTAPAAPTN